MATMLHTFAPGAFSFPAATFASPEVLQGTNAPVAVLRFAKGDKAAVGFRATDYLSGNLTLTFLWSADAAVTGNVVWAAELGAITPETDTTDVTTKALGTLQSVTDAHLTTTARRLHVATLTVSNLDSLAANDYVLLRISRDNVAGDTLVGDAFLHELGVSYTTA